MKRDSRIYVAGHTGLLGSAITRTLKSGGYTGLILKTIDELDLTDQKAVDEFFSKERPEYVIIAAAKVGGIMANKTQRADFIHINLAIENNLIFSSWKYGVKKLLFPGSTCIYPKNSPQPFKEDHLLASPLEFSNEPYAIAKIAGIKLCESFNIQYKTNFISMMPSNLYGPGDNYDLETSHVLPALLRKFHLGRCLEKGDLEAVRRDLNRYPVEKTDGRADEKSILAALSKHGISSVRNHPGGIDASVTVWGTGTPLREFLYSQDLAEASLFLMENVDIEDIIRAHNSRHPDEPGYHAPHFLNIGTGEEISVRELAEKIRDLTGFRGDIVFDRSKPDGTLRKVTDAGILHELGCKHRVTLDEGLRITYGEYLEYE